MTDTPPRQPTPQEEAEDPKHLDRQMVKWTRVVGWFTALLFIANAIGLFFIWAQWNVASKSQIDVREQLRAAVTYQQLAEIMYSDATGKVTAYGFQPQFINSGGTRTGVFRPWYSIKYFDKEVPYNMDFSKPIERVDIVDAVLPANGTSQLTIVSLGAEYIDKIAKKDGVGLIWGHVDWADIFEPKKIHSIDICLLLESITTVDGKTALRPVPYKPECNNAN
jgi:hypothetical protein